MHRVLQGSANTIIPQVHEGTDAHEGDSEPSNAPMHAGLLATVLSASYPAEHVHVYSARLLGHPSAHVAPESPSALHGFVAHSSVSA